MFSDRVTIHVEAGRGGDGSLAFRREKFVPRGGPAGGDGGHGGDVVLLAEPSLRDLTALRFAPHVRAANGSHGEGSQKTGATGGPVIVPVPVGTQVFGDDGSLVCDLAHAGARVVIARGGRGGAGNRRFTTATRQAPRIAGVGEEGETRTLDLHLKLLADAALLGFPNVGKSSLLRRISNATPKVADYPFTTIEPVLGTVEAHDGSQLTVVDVPGLLEGASDGVGLGHEFLAHLERARTLIHTVPADDVEADFAAARDGFAVIWGELKAHGHGLADRPRIVVLNRIDLVAPDLRAALVERFADAIAEDDDAADENVVRDAESGRPIVIGTSCATGEGIPSLIAALFRTIPPLEAEPVRAEGLADYLVYRPGSAGRAGFRLFREEGGFRVSAKGIEEAAVGLDPDREADAQRLGSLLESAGVIVALRRAGAKEGDDIRVGSIRFTYVPDTRPE